MSRPHLAQVALLFVLALSLVTLPARALAQATPEVEASPATSTQEALGAGVTWLQAQQAADGSWLGFSGTPDAGVTIDAFLALVAASNSGVAVDLAAATEFITANGIAYAETGTGQAAKVVMAAVAIGLDPRAFGGVDLIEEMKDGFNSQTDFYGLSLYDHALYILAMAAAGEVVPDDAITVVAERQLEDGSWAFDGTKIVGNGDSNTTAIVIQALVAVGATEGDQIMHGLEYLAGIALPGGFSFQPGPGAEPDANSTALVVQALIAAGEDPAAQQWLNVAGSLQAFQNESGSFSYQLEPRDDNLFASVQVIPAMTGQALPISASGESTPVALPTCTADQLASPPVDAELPCAA